MGPRLFQTLCLCLCGIAIGGSSLVAQEHATPAEAIRVREGFRVDRVYSVPKDQGSWVAMCFDDRGRIYASDQGPRLYRITPPEDGVRSECLVEVVSDRWGFSQGMSFINGALYLIQHGDRSEENFRPDVLLRITDADGDGNLDAAEPLIEFPRVGGDAANWVEHSLHAVIPGPDGKSIYIVSGDRNGLPCEKGRVPKHWNRDSWEFASTDEPYSGGWVLKADLDGKNAEYLCIGLRNCYDLAFNREGDLFTYDSDLENDFGLPNYRPTAIRHVLSGTDSGWGGRAGEMLWSWTPAWEDIQPPIKNIGPGSPTGICFGYGAKFPVRYQQALFACDWSYGRMFAVHLTPSGASYTADHEPFLSAQGLPIADVGVSPHDGSLYFLTGGRGTQSGIYRVTYIGSENTGAVTESLFDESSRMSRELRVKLESYHGENDPSAIELVWPHLGNSDRAIRSAARAALEWQPVAEWKQRALREPNSRIGLQALLSLVRSTDRQSDVQKEILTALNRWDLASLESEEQRWYLRILTISASRHGRFDDDVATRILRIVELVIPSPDRIVNEEIVALCVALRSKGLIEPALSLLQKSRTQEEQVVYVQALTSDGLDWIPEQRKRFFQMVLDLVPNWKGGFTARARRDHFLNRAIQMLNEAERQEFAEKILIARKPSQAVPPVNRPFVRNWSMDELLPNLENKLAENRNLENGKHLFAAASCIACHSFQGEGGLGGPDLTSAAGRYNAFDLLENILSPSKVINEQYGLQIYQLKDGTTFTGRTVNMAGDTVMIATNPNDPGGTEVRFKIQDLERSVPSRTSSMPEGLLNTLSHEDILDLIAYIRGR